MELKPGARLRSAVCETQVVVVRAPRTPVAVACGGIPLVPLDDAGGPVGEPDPAFADGTLLGKRYVDGQDGLELLCTRGGTGSLSVDGVALSLKSAKPLPSSD